jgi:hypothetical protein
MKVISTGRPYLTWRELICGIWTPTIVSDVSMEAIAGDSGSEATRAPLRNATLVTKPSAPVPDSQIPEWIWRGSNLTARLEQGLRFTRQALVSSAVLKDLAGGHVWKASELIVIRN